jgi:hypothetical protein
MKCWSIKVFGLLGLWLFLAGNCVAADLEALDRVSVNMDRSAVRNLLGPPNAERVLSIGLEADVYDLEGLEPLIGKGCVYSKGDILVGQAFVFEGSVADATAKRLEKNGFSFVEKKQGAILLTGKDDDTGHPIKVSISENEGVTTVVTFEKDFYQKSRGKKVDK